MLDTITITAFVPQALEELRRHLHQCWRETYAPLFGAATAQEMAASLIRLRARAWRNRFGLAAEPRASTAAAPKNGGTMPNACRQFSLGVPHRKAAGALALLLGACASWAAQAQSFDCAKASKPVERLICGEPALAALDGALGAEVKKALAAVPANRHALLADARRWLAERDKRCPVPAAALTAADRSRAASCLTAAYRERIAALRSAPASIAAPGGGGKALCQQFANDYKAHRKIEDDRSPLTILSTAPGTPVTLAKPVLELTGAGDAEAQAAEWAQGRQPPFVFSPAVLKDFAGTPGIQSIERLPGTDFYAASAIQGTALCYASVFFEVKNGRAEPAAGPGGWDGQDADNCGVWRTFGTIGKAKAAFEESHSFTPALTSSVSVTPWEHGRFGAACTASFTFAPHFEARVSPGSAAEESCDGVGCEELRQAALRLAQRVQSDIAGVEKAEAARLTPSQRKDYETLKSLAGQAGEAGAPQTQETANADSLLDTAPLLLPLVHNGQVYLASIGHVTLGWRTYADWSVKLDRLQDGKAQARASFAIGMKRGPL